MNEHIKNEEIKYLGDVQRLVLKPGDTVVLSTTQSISREQADMLKAAIERELAGHKVLVLSAGLKIGVIGTINEARAQSGLPPIEDGEMPYLLPQQNY